jgi:chaperonin cofactor prefoldin
MIVGEALTRRSDLQKRVEQLQERLRRSVLVQEGDEPPESPEELLAEFGSVCDELELLIAQINHTNTETRLTDGQTVTEALARRDVLGVRQSGLRSAVRAATKDGSGNGLLRYSRSEIRMVRQISVSELQARIDELAKQQRELDSALQAHNWTTPLIE